MITASFLLMVALTIGIASAADDREYCGHTYSTASYYETSATYSMLSTQTESGANARTSMIAHNPSSGAVTLSRPYSSGIFEQGAIPVAGGFCATGILYSADINGDSRDDLLCKNGATHTFSVRYYAFNSYLAAVDLDQTNACDTSAFAFAVLIGDFNGDKADDIMCIDTAGPTLGPTSFIYFNSPCRTARSHSHNHGRYGRHTRFGGYYSRFHHRGHYHTRCPSNLPAKHAFPQLALSGCDANSNDIIVGDVNGDNKDDLICTTSPGGAVSYSLSNGATNAAGFGALVTPTSAVTCTATPFSVIAADVDGDGDDDLVCVNTQTTTGAGPAVTTNSISYFSGGQYLAFSAATGSPCSTVCDTLDPSIAYFVTYFVGDFNGDGYEDYMCRWDDTTAVTTGIYFSVPK